jgi:methionyl aminopeptidase
VVGGDQHNPEGAQLIKGTKFALDESIKIIKPGVVAKTFAKHMQTHLHDQNISIIKNLTGHGVGNDVHEEPHIYNRPQNSMKNWSFVE